MRTGTYEIAVRRRGNARNVIVNTASAVKTSLSSCRLSLVRGVRFLVRVQRNAYTGTILIVTFFSLFAGCMSGRMSATPLVNDRGASISTKNKYSVQASPQLMYLCEQRYPSVFAENGIPIKLVCTKKNFDAHTGRGLFSVFISSFSYSVIPAIVNQDSNESYLVKFVETPELSFQFDIQIESKWAMTVFTPFALLMYKGEPSQIGFRNFYKHHSDDSQQWPSLMDDVRQSALAYGMAVKLKELEDVGKIDVAKSIEEEEKKLKKVGRVASDAPVVDEQDARSCSVAQLPAAQFSTPAYNIIACEREAGSDFAYRFVLELTGKDKSLRTFRSVQKEFRVAVKEDYIESFPAAGARSLFVDFPEYKLNNGKIEGRAVVLTISVTSLSYDPETRKGRLAVKVNANQYEEARKWIRKNIETLARDKNIALVTGEIPPAAKFYLGKEELKDGNVLEIEFRTE